MIESNERVILDKERKKDMESWAMLWYKKHGLRIAVRNVSRKYGYTIQSAARVVNEAWGKV